MSRIGKKIITLPAGVNVTITPDLVTIKGPKGELKRKIDSRVHVKNENNTLSVSVDNPEEKKERSLWGTFGAHLANMVVGVTVGYKKILEINGVGYKVAMQGKDLKLEVGYSHSVIYKVLEGIKVSVEKNIITVEGIDKELVGQVAAEIRQIKKPEPYKGKGIKYSDEVIRRKAGKAATKGAS